MCEIPSMYNINFVFRRVSEVCDCFLCLWSIKVAQDHLSKRRKEGRI